MEIIGVEASSRYDKSKPKASVKGAKGEFLKSFSKAMNTVKLQEVEKAYVADHSRWKRDKSRADILGSDEELEEDEVLYKEYKKILMKLYRFRKRENEE